MTSPPVVGPRSIWGSYPSTLLHFESTPPKTIDLREPTSSDDRQFFKKVGLEHPFGIVSAQDPMGRRQPASENARLAASLHQELEDRRLAYVRVTACSPDASHCEKSVALALALQAIVRLADTYFQLAVFWFDGDAFWIIPVRSSLPKVRLPILS